MLFYTEKKMKDIHFFHDNAPAVFCIYHFQREWHSSIKSNRENHEHEFVRRSLLSSPLFRFSF